MSLLAHPRFRRIHALLLCTLWLAGFEVGPGLHVALHDRAGHHHHGAESTDDEHRAAHEQRVAAGHRHREAAPLQGQGGHAHSHALARPQHAAAHLHQSAGHHGTSDHEHRRGPPARAHEHAEPRSHHRQVADTTPAHENAPRDEAVAPISIPVLLAETVARCANDLNHGARALAHRGIAASPTPAAWPPIAVAPWVHLSRASFALDPIRSRAPRCARARGPPV